VSAVGEFICAHAVDRSLLAQGFTLPGAMLVDFTSWFGALSPGGSRDITIRLDGTSHAVRLGNRNFDRVKWPDHGEMYQMRYNPTGTFAKALQTKFSATQKFIADELARHPDLGKKHIKIPAAQREQIVFYRTDDPCVWDAEVQTAAESRDVSQSVGTLDETLFESAAWEDTSARIVLRPAVVKVRRLDRAIGNNLKRVYHHRCQICGLQVATAYDAHVDEVHHLDPFVTSLNNDASNLIVLCPTHHRIVHATHAQFRRTIKSFAYPNGLVEPLKVNLHL